MATIKKAEIAENEALFEMQGHLRIFQKNYMPRKDKEQLELLMNRMEKRIGQKINRISMAHHAITV